MTTQSHFYLTLPSNSSEQYYGRQPLNHFKTKLPHPLPLDRNEWEVGLAEIIYPYTWKNVKTAAIIRLGVSDLKRSIQTGRYNTREITFSIQLSNYMTIQDLIAKLNNRLENTLRIMKLNMEPVKEGSDMLYHGVAEKYWRLEFKYDSKIGKVFLSGSSYIYIVLEANVAQRLGFGDSTVALGSEDMVPEMTINKEYPVKAIPFRYQDDKYNDPHVKLLKGDYIADVHRELTSLYVYSPIVESQFVGDTQAPLLRVVSVNGQYGTTVNTHYNHIYYLPLSQSLIDHVEVYIRDDVGEYIPFDTGRVIVVLHFRKKSL